MLPKQHDVHSGIKDISQTCSITLELTSPPESSIINHRLRSFWRHHMVLFDRASESRWLPLLTCFHPRLSETATSSCVYGIRSSGKLPEASSMWTLRKNYRSLNNNTALKTNKCKKGKESKSSQSEPRASLAGGSEGFNLCSAAAGPNRRAKDCRNGSKWKVKQEADPSALTSTSTEGLSPSFPSRSPPPPHPQTSGQRPGALLEHGLHLRRWCLSFHLEAPDEWVAFLSEPLLRSEGQKLMCLNESYCHFCSFFCY